MKKRKIGVSILFTVLLCGFLPAVSYGQQITIGLTGSVYYVDDPCHFFGGQINPNDTITGLYSYDTSCLDSKPSNTNVGDYWHYTAPYGISVNIGNFVFETNSNDVRFLVEIVNDQSGDSYLIRSRNNICSNGVLVDMIDWALGDYSSTALSSDALPTTAPNLAAWNMDYGLTIRGPTIDCNILFGIDVDVTSVYVIPEPATLLLLVFGIVICKRH